MTKTELISAIAEKTELTKKDSAKALDAFTAVVTETLAKGESEAIDALADYIYENDMEDKVENHAYDNAQIEEILTTLAELNEKAKNSVIEAGTDVTDLLVNGHFDGVGGWTATLNDFSIDSSKQILERWWCDWKAEQIVSNVPNGTYRLEVQGFQWCSWDWSQSENDWYEGDGSPSYKVNSKLRLNDGEVTIHNVFACGKTDIKEGYEGRDYWVPNNATVALKFFELGLYNNVVEATVTDHQLKVEFDCSSNGFWNCFYNLRLYFIGADMEEATSNLRNAVSQADDLLQQKMEGSLRKALEEAKAVGDSLLSVSKAKYDDFNEATNTILTLLEQSAVSVKEYARLASVLARAEETLSDAEAAATEAGQQLKALYDTIWNDYQLDYPTLETSAVVREHLRQRRIGGKCSPHRSIRLEDAC